MSSAILSSLHIETQWDIAQAVVLQRFEVQWVKHDVDFIFLSCSEQRGRWTGQWGWVSPPGCPGTQVPSVGLFSIPCGLIFLCVLLALQNYGHIQTAGPQLHSRMWPQSSIHHLWLHFVSQSLVTGTALSVMEEEEPGLCLGGPECC